MFTSASIKKANSVNMNYSAESAVNLQNNAEATSLPSLLQRAAFDIINGDCSAARELLKGVIAENLENAEIYNLFGISYEREGSRIKASKFYRVAYYMDQTFRSASDNLARVCAYDYSKNFNLISWGIDMREVIS